MTAKPAKSGAKTNHFSKSESRLKGAESSGFGDAFFNQQRSDLGGLKADSLLELINDDKNTD